MDELIASYLNGTASSEEKTQLLKWLCEEESHRTYFVSSREVWLASGAVLLTEKEKKDAFRLFSQKVNDYESKRKRKLFTVSLRVAASIAVLIGCLSASFFLGKNYSDKMIPLKTRVMNQALMGEESKGSVLLPDGTKVWLNAGSRLTYPEAFASEVRTVTLEGEGYFEVKHNNKAPFFVKTEAMTVQVLGTTFDVKNYNHKKTAQTVLLSGAVAVQLVNRDDIIHLTPNQKLSLDKESGLSQIETVDAQEYAIWIHNKLIFHKEPLETILNKMERWYGIEINCTKEVPLHLRLSLTIRKETKEEIFRLLSVIAPIKYKITGDSVEISPR